MAINQKNKRCLYCAKGEKHPTPNEKNSPEFDELHPWFINVEEYDFCFWNYVYRHSAVNGEMKDSSMGEIASFLDCSITTVHLILEKAINKLKKSGGAERLLYYMQRKHQGGDLEGEFNQMLDQWEYKP